MTMKSGLQERGLRSPGTEGRPTSWAKGASSELASGGHGGPWAPRLKAKRCGREHRSGVPHMRVAGRRLALGWLLDESVK